MGENGNTGRTNTAAEGRRGPAKLAERAAKALTGGLAFLSFILLIAEDAPDGAPPLWAFLAVKLAGFAGLALSARAASRLRVRGFGKH